MTMEFIEFVTIDKYRPKNDPIPREIHIYYKLIDDLENLDFKRNCQKQNRLQFVFTTLTVYNSVDKSYYKQATEKLNNLFNEEKMAEFKELEKKQDVPAHSIKLEENEEETDPEILMLEKILAEKRAKKKQQQDEM